MRRPLMSLLLAGVLGCTLAVAPTGASSAEALSIKAGSGTCNASKTTRTRSVTVTNTSCQYAQGRVQYRSTGNNVAYTYSALAAKGRSATATAPSNAISVTGRYLRASLKNVWSTWIA